VDSLPESEEIKPANPGNSPTKLELDLFFNYSLDFLVLVGFDNRFKQVSPSFERILGWTKEEVISKPFYNFLHPDDIEKTLSEVKTHETGKNAVLFENRYRCKDGSYKWISWNSHPLPEKQIIVGIGRDITDRKKVEETLRESEDRFRFALKNAPVSVAAQDRNLRYIWAYNQRTARPDEIIGKLDKEIFTQEEATHFDQVKRRVIEENIELNEQMWFNRPSGRIFLDVTWSPMHDSNGKVIGVTSATVDLTREKLIEKRLEVSEERFSKAFNLSPFAVIMTRLSDGAYVDVNDTFLKMFEFSREEVIGHTANEIKIYAKPDGRAAYLAAFKNGHASDFEVDLKTKTGKPIKALGYAEIINVNGQDLTFGTLVDITERKKAEETLTKKQNELQTIVDSSQGLIFYKDSLNHFIRVNNAFAKIMGLPKEQLEGRSLFELYPKEEADAFWSDDKQVIASGITKVGIEEKMLSKHGQRWVLTDKIPYRDAEGNIIGVIGFSVDITERKKAEEELKKSEEHARQRAEELRKLMDIIPAAVWVSQDPECKVIVGNQAANTFYEAEGEENVSAGAARGSAQDTTRRFFRNGKELMPQELPMQEAAAKNVQIKNSELEVVVPSGRKITIIGNAKPLLDDAGNVRGCLGAFVDITERKKAEEATARQAELIDLSPDAIIVRKLDGTITFWSIGAEKLYGWTRNEAIGQDINTLLRTELPHSLAAIQKRLKEGGKWSGEVVHICKDGSKLVVQSYWLAKFSSDGKISELLESNVDITQRTEMQLKLEESSVRLEEYANQMEDLANQRAAQLKDAERLATIGATAGMVGHDIRNPLQAITGDVFLAKTDLIAIPDSEEKTSVQESLSEIEKNVDYINKIVADLQDFARPLKPNAEETDLKLIIDDLLKKNGLPDTVKITVKVETEALKVVADSTFINRIMYNLVTNAVQAMPKGGNLTIHACKEAKDILITVKDTGVGIPEKVKEKLFTPMFTTKSKGQGFGLAVIKRMTEALGGTVTFESQEGKGTTFIIRLPPKELNGKSSYK
jgi:PAS domain S-box-containing protein